MNGGEWAAIITAAGAFVTALAGALAVITKAVLDVRREARQINRAVNHQDPDEPTLVERVKRIEEQQRELRVQFAEHAADDKASVAALTRRIDALTVLPGGRRALDPKEHGC